MIITALSIHSFFEGMALGVLGNTGEVLALMVAIACHTWAESLSIGAQLAARDRRRQHRKRMIILLLIYAAVSPVGIGVGVLVLKLSSPLVSILCTAVASGTFLYIGATDVPGEDFHAKNKLHKYLWYTLGVAVIMGAGAISINTTGGHSH